MRPVDVAVIGGGIVGTATAAFLAEGGVSVRLYEETAIGAGASGRNSGVVQHPLDPVLAALYRSTLIEYRRLGDVDEGTIRLADEPAGLLYVGRDEGLAAAVAAEWSRAFPATTPEILASADLARLEPALAPDLIACRLAIGYPVAPSAAADAFAEAGLRSGVELQIGGAPARPATVGDRVVGVARGNDIDPAGAVVVAAGPWTAAVVDPTGGWRPIERSWGVVASIAFGAAPRHVLEAIDIEIEPTDDRSDAAVPDAGVAFSLVPAIGSSALGSTFLPTEPEPTAWLDALRRAGARYVPAIADGAVVGLRCCARPISRDGRPLIGAVPWADGLWIAAGHGPWGISTGPGTARLLADRIIGRVDDAGIPLELRADRFGSRAGRR